MKSLDEMVHRIFIAGMLDVFRLKKLEYIESALRVESTGNDYKVFLAGSWVEFTIEKFSNETELRERYLAPQILALSWRIIGIAVRDLMMLVGHIDKEEQPK